MDLAYLLTPLLTWITVGPIKFLANSLRQHVGRQAAAINRLAKDATDHKWLRERMGHTVIEITGGLATGIAIGHLVFALFPR
ncbi:MAG: divergent family protein [Pseudoduganella sp.]|nr:divergent family protein [Pseudoduganella sp.]